MERSLRNDIKLAAPFALVLFLLGANTDILGYPGGYGPFRPGKQPSAIPRNECPLVRNDLTPSKSIEGAVRHYCLLPFTKAQNEISVVLKGTTTGWVITVCDAQGKSLTLASVTNSMTSSQMEVFSCDLNRDNLPDFIVNVWSGGTGLAAVGTEVTLLLSSKAGYRAASFYLYSFGEEDLVQFKAGGPVYFILNDLISSNGEKTRDGHEHNFWVYELYRIDGTRLIPSDADHPGFPKWVWYTNKDNHEETSQLLQEQKTKLLKERNTTR